MQDFLYAGNNTSFICCPAIRSCSGTEAFHLTFGEDGWGSSPGHPLLSGVKIQLLGFYWAEMFTFKVIILFHSTAGRLRPDPPGNFLTGDLLLKEGAPAPVEHI